MKTLLKNDTTRYVLVIFFVLPKLLHVLINTPLGSLQYDYMVVVHMKYITLWMFMVKTGENVCQALRVEFRKKIVLLSLGLIKIVLFPLRIIKRF